MYLWHSPCHCRCLLTPHQALPGANSIVPAVHKRIDDGVSPIAGDHLQ
jgi:hypothetical protein